MPQIFDLIHVQQQKTDIIQMLMLRRVRKYVQLVIIVLEVKLLIVRQVHIVLNDLWSQLSVEIENIVRRIQKHLLIVNQYHVDIIDQVKVVHNQVERNVRLEHIVLNDQRNVQIVQQEHIVLLEHVVVHHV